MRIFFRRLIYLAFGHFYKSANFVNSERVYTHFYGFLGVLAFVLSFDITFIFWWLIGHRTSDSFSFALFFLLNIAYYGVRIAKLKKNYIHELYQKELKAGKHQYDLWIIVCLIASFVLFFIFASYLRDINLARREY